MNDPIAPDGGVSLPYALDEPELVATIREMPDYFPPTHSPDEWVDWLRSSYSQEWSAYRNKKRDFEGEQRRWKAEMAEMEKKRSDLARLRAFQAWVATREEFWQSERGKWDTATKAFHMGQREMDREVADVVSQAAVRVKKAEKKTTEESIKTSQSASPTTDGQTDFPSDGPGEVDHVPEVIVEGGLHQVDSELEEARQLEMEQESVASDVTVSQPASVTHRLHRTLLMRAQLIQVKRQIENLPEGTPETTRKPLESLARKYERRLSRRYTAGVAMAEFLDPFNETNEGVLLMDNKHPTQVETMIEEKLETLLSPSAKSINLGFRLAKRAKEASRQKTNAIQLLEDYGLFDYTIENALNKKIMTVTVPEESFEAWVLSYCERKTRVDERD